MATGKSTTKAGAKVKAPKAPSVTENAALVIIPYKADMSAPQSLHMAIAAWQKFATFSSHIVILGDNPDMELPAGVEHVSAPQDLTPHVNECRALKAFLSGRKEETFVVLHDDMVVLHPFSLSDLRPKALHTVPELSEDSDNYFIADLARTFKALGDAVFFSCHSPHVYNRKFFLNMIDTYNLTEVGMDFMVLYHNLANVKPEYLSNPFDNGYCFLIMQSDGIPFIESRISRHLFCSFGGSCTRIAYYQFINEYLQK